MQQNFLSDFQFQNKILHSQVSKQNINTKCYNFSTFNFTILNIYFIFSLLAVRREGGRIFWEGWTGGGEGAGRQQQRGEGGTWQGGCARGGEEAFAPQIVHRPGTARDEAPVGGVQRARDRDDRHQGRQVRHT